MRHQTPAACAAVIREREAAVRAFAWLDLERALRSSAAAPPGPLRGRWVGIKDVIDTAGIPTERGSALPRPGSRPLGHPRDADRGCGRGGRGQDGHGRARLRHPRSHDQPVVSERTPDGATRYCGGRCRGAPR